MMARSTRRGGLALTAGGLAFATCGAVLGKSKPRAGRTVQVTSLANDGPGTLRQAIRESGPGIRIGFEVGGTIRLQEDLIVTRPGVEIDGGDGPSPGITLEGATLRIRASETQVRHLRVRPGDGPGTNPVARDGIAIDGKEPLRDVLVEHCSIAWAIDEGMAVAAGAHERITLRRNLIAEQLHESIHDKGAHSRGLLIASGHRDVLVEQNLFAHNYARNPVVSSGTAAAIVNNLIYNFGSQSIHFYQNEEPVDAVVAGNVLIFGPDSLPQGIETFGPEIERQAIRAIVVDNLVVQGDVKRAAVNWSFGRPRAVPLGERLPSQEVEPRILDIAGAHPRDRDATDQRLIRDVIRREGRIRDRPVHA